MNKRISENCSKPCGLFSLKEYTLSLFQELWLGPNIGMFRGIETHDIPKVHDDGVVQDVVGNVYFSLKPSRIKQPLGRPRKK